MSLADKIFVDMCKDILDNGTSTEGELVRPHWEDGASAYTIKKFGVVNRYDFRQLPCVRRPSRPVPRRCCGSGSANPTTFMI